MKIGPIGSEYPGTPVAILMAFLFAFLFVNTVMSAFRRWRNKELRQRYWASIFVAIVAAYLFVMVVMAIITATQNNH